MNDEAIIAEPEIYITRLVPSTDDISGNSRDRSSFGSHVSEHIFRSVYSYTDLRLGMYLSFVVDRPNRSPRAFSFFLLIENSSVRTRNLFTRSKRSKRTFARGKYFVTFVSLERFWKQLAFQKQNFSSFSNSDGNEALELDQT